MTMRSLARLALGGALITELGVALHRFESRRRVFEAAARRASLLQRPLVVVGDPDAGAHTRIVRAYGCGDLCVDMNGCPMCQVTRAADITKGPVAGLADDSAVVFVSCVLEYVSDPVAALHELRRIAGSPENLFLVFVEPWTLTASLYPGARWAGGVVECVGSNWARGLTALRVEIVAGSRGQRSRAKSGTSPRVERGKLGKGEEIGALSGVLACALERSRSRRK